MIGWSLSQRFSEGIPGRTVQGSIGEISWKNIISEFLNSLKTARGISKVIRRIFFERILENPCNIFLEAYIMFSAVILEENPGGMFMRISEENFGELFEEIHRKII